MKRLYKAIDGLSLPRMRMLLSLQILLSFAALIPLCCLAQTKEVLYLSGTGSDNTVAWDFFCTGGRKSGYWTTIQVPSCWEQQGFGSYNYGRDYKTYGKNFRFADEQGMYKHRFTVPDNWRGQKIFIVFEGSMTDTEVKVNGKLAGAVHQGAFYRFKYDITDKIKIGAVNLLEVTVSKMSAEKSVNNAERLADYWVFGGIFRPVYLEAVPTAFIEYASIDAKADGAFSMKLSLADIAQKGLIKAVVLDAAGKQVAAVNAAVNNGDSIAILTTKADHILPWTSESPNMYKVNIALHNAAGVIYRTSQKFGFRTIEIRRGDGIYINGVQVKLKGTNRHCWSPETGRTLNDSLQLLDVQLLKEMNMNAVRCSHYPPDARFLDLCDSLGLYVLDELAGWQKAYSTAAGEPLVKEMVLKDMNHPSVIIWNNGNEGGTNKNLDDDFLKWDYSQRPVIHPHHKPGNAFNGIDCNHYEDYYSTKQILNDSLIYMPTEFLHAQDDGGAGAAMYDFWELHWKAKRSGGGFVWAMVDEGIMRTDMNNRIDANGLNANDGIMGPHREKEGSFFALREIFAPVHIEMKELPADFSGAIELENRYHFTNLNQCRFQWALVNYSRPFDVYTAAGYTVKKKGSATVSSVPPLATGKLQLGLPADYVNYDALVLVATDKFGKEIYKWIWKVKNNARLLKDVMSGNDGATSVTETDTTFSLQGGGITIVVNKKTGLLVSSQSDAPGISNLSFTNGPVFTHGSSIVKNSRSYKEGKAVVIEYAWEGALTITKWTMQPNGWVSLEYEYRLNGSFPFAGVSFSYPENFMLGAKWLGKGPYRQWKNRTHGTPVNVWQNLYNNTQTGYSPMVYPEFKGYYGDITWMEFNTVEGRFYVASEDTGLYVRLFDFYGLTGVKPFPELPVGNISFLDCIPAIGTKLALNISPNTAVLGPQSEPTSINGPVKRRLYFYFGLPKTSNAKEQYSRPEIDNVF